MYNKKFLLFLADYILDNLPIITFFLLTLLFIINSFFNSGLLVDGTYTFINLLQDITWDNENRHFETFFSNFATIAALVLGLKNINILIIIHGFWIYFSTLLLLFISYKLFPLKQKDLFLFVLISYLLTMNTTSAFVTTQSFISAGLYWIIIIPMIFDDFNTISNGKIIIMIIASFFMIKGYQLDLVFIMLFVFISFMLLKNIKTNKKYLFCFFILINIWSLIYNFVCRINKNFVFQKVYTFYEISYSPYFGYLLVLLSLIFIIITFIIRNRNFNATKILILIVFIYLITINFIYSLASFRTLNHLIPLILSFLLYIINKKNLNVNLKCLKIFSLVLLLSFIWNITCINYQWNKELNRIYSKLIKSEGIIKFDNYNKKLHEHYFLHHSFSILLQKQKGISIIKSVLEPHIQFYSTINETPRIVFPDLEKYGIYYSDKLKKSSMKLKLK